MDTTPLIFVLYDGIANSVFESQVLTFLKKKAAQNPYQPIHIISFERTITNPRITMGSIQISCIKRLPFLGNISIWHATHKLRTILRLFPTYHLLARGPIAGLIAFKAHKKNSCLSFTVQARGLLADEYAYVNKDASLLTKTIHTIREYQLRALEKKIYRKPIAIESVSNALKQRLIGAFEAEESRVSVTADDIPPKIAAEKIAAWRQAVRIELNIPYDWNVYCYNGSGKKWQRPDLIVEYFRTQLHKEKRSFLLILTQDVAVFKKIIGQTIAHAHYALRSVSHDEIYRYLAGVDQGLIFRDDAIINWVARPTKALEYQAVGIPIIHNNTIEYLCK